MAARQGNAWSDHPAGVRRQPEAYAGAIREFTRLFGQDRVILDPLWLLAYGTDASFYRLIPQVVVKVESEAEAAVVLAACRRDNLPRAS
jgi:D-lactate dehydrogenase